MIVGNKYRLDINGREQIAKDFILMMVEKKLLKAS
jgi:hypothetical protein